MVPIVERVVAGGDRAAVVDPGGMSTFSQLDVAARTVAAKLGDGVEHFEFGDFCGFFETANPASSCFFTCSLSVMRGRRFFRMFSTKLVEGASSVADEVLLIADSSAPKNRICITNGIFVSTKVGSRRW